MPAQVKPFKIEVTTTTTATTTTTTTIKRKLVVVIIIESLNVKLVCRREKRFFRDWYDADDDIDWK